jgi:hypothetical protein
MKLPGSDNTPIMRRAKMMIESREKLYLWIRDSPQMSANKMAKLIRMFEELTKQINKRTFTEEQVAALLTEVKVYSRNYRRIGQKLKISKRAVKYVYKLSKQYGKATATKKSKEAGRRAGGSGTQRSIFGSDEG